ncbi:FAD-dependent oxidoreductase [Dactylosporangium sp. NPDC000521]|uniref:FAD-dependent oxidoreductase n=1 Tax=Dactylosporangium sp. NPDC000521 TaxID=3363975 RepID=UPI0036C2E8A8
MVVGARCAGASTALLLARRGYRVLLLDRASLPSDTLSTHYIHPGGLALLARWGLLDSLMATGCPPIQRISHQVGDVRLEAMAPTADWVGFSCAPRRQVLDAVPRHRARSVRTGCRRYPYRTVARDQRPAELLSSGLWTGLGSRRRRRSPQGFHHRTRYHRRVRTGRDARRLRG